MDAAVGIVETYLRVNGCFTVTEYPILVRGHDGQMREATDVDMIAIRLAGGGRVLPSAKVGGRKMDIDETLDMDWQRTELILAEVKEGAADPNPAMFDRGVLHEALRRFGCVDRHHISDVCKQLQDEGEAIWEGHRVRLMTFGSRPPHSSRPGTYISLGHCLEFLDDYVRHQRTHVGQPRFRDPVLAHIAIRIKSEA